MLEKLSLYAQLMRLDRPIGILLLLWPTLWGLWLAADVQDVNRPDLWVFVVFVLGVVLMRSAGCVINDFADRKVDPHVARTKDRPIASGRVSSREALVLFAVLCGVAFALVLTLNMLTIGLSFVAAFLAASYPFMKRFTHLPQAYLGAAFGFAVPMAFAAQTGGIPPIAWLLFAITLVWAVIYDTPYAMVDREDDVKIGVKSTAILFGQYDRVVIGLLQGLMLVGLSVVGVWAQLAWPFWVSILLAAGLFGYQQWLMREREPEACFAAFLNNQWVGLFVFIGMATAV